MSNLMDQKWSLDQCITEAFATSTMGEETHNRLLSELRTMRAEAAKVAILEEQLLNSKKSNQSLIEDLTEAEPEAEAWRAVRKCWDRGNHVMQLFEDIKRQIARLDAMKEGK